MLEDSRSGESVKRREATVRYCSDSEADFRLLTIPYWSIVIPLTLLSAYLLLSKPRVGHLLDCGVGSFCRHAPTIPSSFQHSKSKPNANLHEDHRPHDRPNLVCVVRSLGGMTDNRIKGYPAI